MTIIASVNTLLSVQRLINGKELAGWQSLDEKIAKERINSAAIIAKRAQKDINLCQEIMQNGCNWCKTQDQVHYQEIRKTTDQVQYQEIGKITGKFSETKRNLN